jgi:hypothetical protein
METPQGTVLIIDSYNAYQDLRRSVCDAVFKTYLLAFQYNKLLIDIFDESLLKTEIIDFWFEYFLFDYGGQVAIYEVDKDKLERRLYEEFIEASLNLLVDYGILQLCWDSETDQVIWTKVNK